MTTYYHVQELGGGSRLARPPHSLILKPQTPRHPAKDQYDDVIEDNFTARVSLGESPEACVAGIEDHGRYYELYRTIGSVVVESPTTAGPSSPGNDYGPDFEFSTWVEYQAKRNPEVSFEGVASPKDLPDTFREEFEFCVPDVDTTSEVWSLKPVRMEYMGVYDAQKKSIIAEPDETSQKAARIRSLASLLDSIASRF